MDWHARGQSDHDVIGVRRGLGPRSSCLLQSCLAVVDVNVSLMLLSVCTPQRWGERSTAAGS